MKKLPPANPNDEEINVLLLSFPRCGNTWYRYAMEWLTKKPTVGGPGRDPAVDWKLNGALGVDMKKPLLMVKRHWPSDKISTDSKIILILRNYRECVSRHVASARKEDPYVLIDRYVDNVTYFHHKFKKRLCIYYEDFLKNPEPILKKSLDFLEESDARLEGFVTNLIDHKNRSVNLYKKFQGYSQTGGSPKKLLHYSNAMTKEKKWAWDSRAQQRDPWIYSKYLSRYKS